MEKIVDISKANGTNEEKVLAGIIDAARAGLMGLSPEVMADLVPRQRQLTFSILKDIKELSRKRLGVLTLGPQEWEQFGGGDPFTAEQKEILELKLWGLDTFDSRCNFHSGSTVGKSHIMLATPYDMSMAWLQDRFHKRLYSAGHPCFWKYGADSWYIRELFAKESTPRFGWHLIPMELPLWILEKPKTSQQLMEMIPDDYEVVSASLEAMKNIAVFLLTGTYPNSNRYANTSDIIKQSEDGPEYWRVRVGTIPCQGISVSTGRDAEGADWRVGVAVERKIEMPFPGHMTFDLR